MPSISSITRRPEGDGVNVDLACPSLDGVGVTIEPHKLELPDAPEVLSLLSFIDALDIEQKDLADIKAEAMIGKLEPRRSGLACEDLPAEYIIGTGVSSTVMLLTPPEDVQSSTTLVAYKRYTPTHQGPVSDRRIYHWLWHELTSLCHPALREHENICKLKHIAWEDSSVIPIIGLEFAHFGTLEDCLQDLRSYSSAPRKSHLSLDIAMGAAAIHSAGLVHGDLKPRNILVSHHPLRGVVAQISDLTGVAAASSYGANDFAVRTPTWQPPEALQPHPSTDWQLADVYSFGMVMATMWSAEGFIPPGGTFLDSHMKYQLTAVTKRALIEYWKLQPDQEAESMINLACQSLPPPSTTGIQLSLIAKSTLSCHQRNRKSMQDILTNCFLTWAHAAERDLSCPVTTVTESRSSLVPWNDGLIHDVNIGCDSFISRPSAFQTHFFRKLLAACERIKCSLPAETFTDIDENTTLTGEELQRYIASIGSTPLKRCCENKRIISALTSLGFSYIWGLGVDVDEQAGLEWLALAARLGSRSEQTMFCLVEESADYRLPMELPRRLWCAISMFNHGGVSASGYLKDTHPGLYASVQMSSRLDRWWLMDESFISAMKAGYLDNAPVGKYLDPQRLYGEDCSTALHVCAMAGDKPSVEYLLLVKQADINATTTANETPIFHAVRGGNLQVARYLCQQGAETHHVNTDGLTILHLLPLMEDTDAAKLAPLLIHGGADLKHATTKNLEHGLHQFLFLLEVSSIPLFWAALKCRPALFAKLLSLHSSTGERLSIEEYHILIYILSVGHHSEMLSLAVKSESEFVNMDLEAGFNHTPSSPLLRPPEYTQALLISMAWLSPFNLLRRIDHRKGFRHAKTETIKLLLALGANPAMPGREHQPALYQAITHKDTDAFCLFIDHMNSEGIAILPAMSDLDSFDGCNALQRAILNDARGIFMLLLEMCPSLINVSNNVGLTPLHFAAVQTWPGYASKLLLHGADPYAEDENGFGPFVQALAMNPDSKSAAEIADIIYASAERSRILGPSQGGGVTAFGQLLGHRNLRADRVECFIQKYGKPDYHATPSLGQSVFQWLIGRNILPSHKAANAQRGAVMEILVQTFPSEINAHDIVCNNSRLTPLQVAAYRGQISIVEALIKHGAGLDLEVAGDDRYVAGHTAIGLALFRKIEVGCPAWILKGGRRERELFNKNLEQIIELLVRHGSRKAGSGATTVTRGQLFLTINPHFRGMVSFNDLSADARHCTRQSQGDWPRMMPWEGNGVSPLDPEVVETVHPNGLSKVSLRKEFQSSPLNFLTGPRVQPGNYVQPAPEPPSGFENELQPELGKGWKYWKGAAHRSGVFPNVSEIELA